MALTCLAVTLLGDLGHARESAGEYQRGTALTDTAFVTVIVTPAEGYALPAPGRMTLRVDGEPMGASKWTGEVAVGYHWVDISGPDIVPARQLVNVRAGEHATVTLVVAPPSAPRPPPVAPFPAPPPPPSPAQPAAPPPSPAPVPPANASAPPPLSEPPPQDAGFRETQPAPPEPREDLIGEATPHPEKDDYKDSRGFYVDVFALGVFESTADHEWRNGRCPDPLSDGIATSCYVSNAAGLGGGGRLAYNFGIIALEGVGLGFVDAFRSQIDGGQLPSFATDMVVARSGGSLGLGARLLSKSDTLRGGIGVNGGYSLRVLASSANLVGGSTTVYHAPYVMVDAEFMIANLFFIGAFAMFEFSGDVRIQPDVSGFVDSLTPDTSSISDPELAAQAGQALDAASNYDLSGLDTVTVSRGTQIFFGPMVGFHFGK